MDQVRGNAAGAQDLMRIIAEREPLGDPSSDIPTITIMSTDERGVVHITLNKVDAKYADYLRRTYGDERVRVRDTPGRAVPLV
jgi:hypothetical protein